MKRHSFRLSTLKFARIFVPFQIFSFLQTVVRYFRFGRDLITSGRWRHRWSRDVIACW